MNAFKNPKYMYNTAQRHSIYKKALEIFLVNKSVSMLSKALYDAVTELEENKHYFDKSFKYFVGNIMHIFPELLEHKPKGVTNYLWWHPKHRGARVRVLKAMINKTKN